MKLSEEYYRYLKSKSWRKLKLSAFARYGRQCQCCGSKKKLHGHHLIYRSPLSSGRVEDIMPLCEVCHEVVHKTPKIDRGFRLLGEPNQRREFIIRCFRSSPKAIAPKPVQVMPKPVVINKPQPKLSPNVGELALMAKLHEAKVRAALIIRANNTSLFAEGEIATMSTKSIRKRMARERKQRRKRATEGTISAIAQMKAQLAANPNCTHFVFSA